MTANAPERSLVLLDTARQAIAEAKTVDDLMLIRDRLEAMRYAAKQAKVHQEIVNDCAEMKLRTERRIGEMLAEMPKNVGAQGSGSNQHELRLHDETTPTYADLGIEKTQAHRWQSVASVPEPEFERHIAETKAAGEELTTASVLRLTKPDVQPEHLAVHYSSESAEWYTPQDILARVVGALGRIDLDPCSEEGSVHNVPALEHFTVATDGLSRPWLGAIYMNPPYGRAIGDWVAKLCSEYRAGHTTAAIALVPARTDTDWFRQFRDYAVCFIDGRLKFSGMENSAPFPSCAVYLGEDVKQFHAAFRDLGDVWLRYEDLS